MGRRPAAVKRKVLDTVGIMVDNGGPGEFDTARLFHRLGGEAMEEGGLLPVLVRVLTGEKPRRAATASNSGEALSPWVVSLNLRGSSLTTEVIPPPRDGWLTGRDGRTYRVKSMAALAAAINTQNVAPRVDFDHRSERSSPTFSGRTRAEGWVSNCRVNAGGGIDADMQLNEVAAAEVAGGAYRYLSPALELDKQRHVIGLSSVALVNDPNFSLSLRVA